MARGKDHQDWHRNRTQSMELLLRCPDLCRELGVMLPLCVCVWWRGFTFLVFSVSLYVSPHLCFLLSLSPTVHILLSSGPLHMLFPLLDVLPGSAPFS